MKIISHRANLSGPHTAKFGENHPNSILHAIDNGFDVEIDVWFENDRYFLGHDNPAIPIELSFMKDNCQSLWIHAKNIPALRELLPISNINVFYHNDDDCVLTSQGYIWTFPDASNFLSEKSIAVLPERVINWNLTLSYAACTDYTDYYK